MPPSGTLPDFKYVPKESGAGTIRGGDPNDDPDQSKFPIGTQGRAAVYTNPHSGFVFMRRIGIRAYTWFNFLYPFSG